MAQMTILTGPERRRRWSDEQRDLILAEAFKPGARVCDVARRHDVARSLIYQWRRAVLCKAEPVFARAVVVSEPAGQASTSVVAAEFDLPDGCRLRIFASASPALAAAALKALR
jgi:transposase